MPPNRFESEVESFLEGSHGDRTHIKRADHHTVTPLCGTLLRASERCRSTSCVNTENCDCRLSSIQSATKALKCSEKRAMRTPASTTPSTVMPSTCSSSSALGGTTLHRTETAGTRTASAWTARSDLCPRREGAQTQTSGFASHNGIPRATSALAPMKTRSSLPACCTANSRARDTASQTAHRELRN